MVEQRYSLNRLLFVGTGLTDYLDILARAGWEDKVSEAGAQALRQMGSWTVADLQQVRPDATVWNVFESWAGPRVSVWQNGCPVLDLKPWDEMLVPLSKNLRKMIRRSIRRLEDDGVHCELAGSAKTEQAARRLVALHRESWQGRDISPEHSTQRFESSIAAAARRMAACGLGAISEFRRDGEVIVSTFWVFGRDFVGAHTLGASEEALRRYQVSSLYIWNGVNLARDRNSSHLDLGQGVEPYKLRWNPRIVPNHRMILGQRWITWIPYVGYHALRARAKWYARSDTVPAWIKAATARFRKVRYKVNRYVKSM
jgi:hypothetical protein